jgi:hypothetical protein
MLTSANVPSTLIEEAVTKCEKVWPLDFAVYSDKREHSPLNVEGFVEDAFVKCLV